MHWFLTTFWRSLIAISGLVGILYLWSDIEGLPEALAKPQAILMANRETLLFCFCLFLVVLVVWRDLWPFSRQFMGLSSTLKQQRLPRSSDRLAPVKRLLLPVTFEYDRVLRMNARGSADFVDFSVYAVFLNGRNNRNKDIEVSGTLQVECLPLRIPFFMHVNGVNRTKDGKATIGPFESFVAYASLSDPENGTLISDNRISDALFLRDYAPFTNMLRINGKPHRRRFSYSRIRSEIDHERDRILFYHQNKAD